MTSSAVRMLPATPALTSSTSAFEMPFLDGAERAVWRYDMLNMETI